jgi:hypothetical protein
MITTRIIVPTITLSPLEAATGAIDLAEAVCAIIYTPGKRGFSPALVTDERSSVEGDCQMRLGLNISRPC